MSAIASLFRKKESQAPMGGACNAPIMPGGKNGQGGPAHDESMTGASCSLDLAPLSIVEFFQSQGCSSCPPTVPLVHNATMNPNFLLLTYNVTYFDHTGWKDTLATPMADNRQRAYNTMWNRANVYTPQLVVNGVVYGNPASAAEVQALFQRTMDMVRSMQLRVMLDVMNNKVRISASGQSAQLREQSEAMGNEQQALSTALEVYELLIVRYDPEPLTVKPKAGQNKGKKLIHRNVVRELVKVAEWSGGEAMVTLPTKRPDGLERVLILQGLGGGPIVAAVKL